MRTIKISDNDVYYLEHYRDYIIINNNYAGFSIYDMEFHKLNNLVMPFEAAVDFSYVSGNNLLMYCDENNRFIIIDNLKIYQAAWMENTTIPFPSKYYEIEQSGRLLIPAHDRTGIYIFDPIKKDLIFKYNNDTDDIEASIIRRCNRAFSEGVFLKSFPRTSQIMKRDGNRLYLENLQNSDVLEIGEYFKNSFRFDYLNKTILQIDEDEAEIQIEKQKFIIHIPYQDMYFINGFLSDFSGGTRVILLAGSKTDRLLSLLLQYSLEEVMSSLYEKS